MGSPDPAAARRLPPDGGRLAFLDGLRGLAALQVVALHYCAAFLPGLGTQNPALARYGWEDAWLKAPLFFLVDGTFAVYVFFAISGAVLTIAFARRPNGIPLASARRAVRLGGPMAAALAFSALLMSAMPRAHLEAAALSGSLPWLGSLMTAPGSLDEVVHQAATSGMLLGYRESSLLPRAVIDALGPDAIGRSLDAPLWTLHVEFWGSVLIAGLAVLRRWLPGRPYAAVVVVATLLLSRHAFLAFMVGHAFALSRTGEGRRAGARSRPVAAAGLIGLGVGIWGCTNPPWAWVTAWSGLPGPFNSIGPIHLQNLYAAVALFAGVMVLEGAERPLRTPLVRWLGRNSFGLYLLHFPILFTVASAVFASLHGRVHYGEAVLAAAAVGVPTSFAAAAAFTAFVDRPFIGLSRLLGAAAAGRPASARIHQA